MTEVILEGSNKFQKDIQRAIEELADLGGPMQNAANTILADARGAAPRLTGRLASSLVPSSSPMVATVQTNLIYANPIHWGWPAHGIERNPFLAESARASESVWIRGFENHVDKAIQLMAKKYA